MPIDQSELDFLIVEDNADDAEIISMLLRDNFSGCSVSVAGCEEELVALLDGQVRFSIVISDWSLPQFNGLEALKLIQERKQDAPFFLVSGKIGEEATLAIMKQGAYDYISKDNLHRLPRAVRHALEIYENRKIAEQDARLISIQATALNASSNAMVIADSSFKILWVNPACLRLTGYSASEMIGKDCRKFCGGPESAEGAISPSCGGAPVSMSGKVKRKDGKIYLEARTIIPIMDPDGNPDHIVILKKDITRSEQEKLQLTLDARLSESIPASGSLDAICSAACMIMAELFPEARFGIYLFTDGERQIQHWYSGHGIDYTDIIPALTDREFASDPAISSMRIINGDDHIATLFLKGPLLSAWDYGAILRGLAERLEKEMQRSISRASIASQIRNISFLKLISRSINATMDFNTVINPILERILEFLSGDAVALYTFEKEKGCLVCRAEFGFRTSNLDKSIRFGEPYVGIAAEEQRITSVSDFRYINGEFAGFIAAEGFLSQHCTPIIIAGKTIGVLELFQRKPFSASPEWLTFFDAIALQTGLALDYNDLYAELQTAYMNLGRSYDAIIEGWSAAMDMRDEITEGHSKRVTSLACALAVRLGLGDADVESIRKGSLLHDIGKIGIPDSVLKKEGPLDEGEWVLMKSHPRLAYEMLSKIPCFEKSLEIPLYHHERWDGSGYPFGLKGKDIPLGARFFAIIDVYDALTSNRPYRDPWVTSRAIEYLRNQAGILFDPELVERFMDMMKGIA